MQATRKRFLRRMLPHPALSALVFIVWLLLANVATLAQCLLAALFACLLPLLLEKLIAHQWLRQKFSWRIPRVVKPWLLLRFAAMVGFDIAIANFEVALRVLQPNRRLRPAFVEMPLQLRDEFTIALLMSVITLTPGTLSARLSDDRRSLLIHALHGDDAAALVAQLQRRYQRPLQQIFMD